MAFLIERCPYCVSTCACTHTFKHTHTHMIAVLFSVCVSHSLLSGEALRSTSNDFNKALDFLLSPSKRAALNLGVSLELARQQEVCVYVCVCVCGQPGACKLARGVFICVCVCARALVCVGV